MAQSSMQDAARNISPYLAAIQSLQGEKPGEKYKQLNLIIKEIIANNQQENINTLPEIPPALIPLIQVRVGIALKKSDVVVEALKSEDKTILHQALRAKWFFDSSNPLLEANYFLVNIMPYICIRTRFKIIKVLSQCLVGEPSKAEAFFRAFEILYGFQETQPLLPACSESFIFNQIVQRKMILTHNMLLTLYKRHPKLVIRYLNLGNYKNESNGNDRKIHSIDLNVHATFLPYLIRHHVHDFIELRKCSSRSVKLGSTFTAQFFKNAVDVVIKNPNAHVQIWPLKVVCRKLTQQQFEEMYANLFPEKWTHFNMYNMLNTLRFYPQEKRLGLLTSLYKSKYKKDLFDSMGRILQSELDLVHELLSTQLFEELFIFVFPPHVDYFKVETILSYLYTYPAEKKLDLIMKTFKTKYGEDLLDDVSRLVSERFLRLLPPDTREIVAKKIVELYEEKSPEYYEWCTFMPLRECFPIFKEAISKSSDDMTRYAFLKRLLICSSVYGRKEDLLNVLRYYNIRHKNERIEVLSLIFLDISAHFDLKKLDREHWQIIRELLQRAYVKNELTKLSCNQVGPLLGAAVYYLMLQETSEKIEMIEEENKAFLDEIFDMTIHYNVEGPQSKWVFLINYPATQKYCLERLVNLLPEKYPPQHAVWQSLKGVNRKINTFCDIIDAIRYFNDRHAKDPKDKGNAEKSFEKLSVSDYPWLPETAKELFNLTNCVNKKLFDTKRFLQRYDPDTYFSIIGGGTGDDRNTDSLVPVPIYDIRCGAAWLQLKKNQATVLANWVDYLAECRERLKSNSKHGGMAARRFLLTAKWCEDLPVKFVERCLTEIKEPGSMKVLGILLEGEAFGKLVTSYAPQEAKVDISHKDAKEHYTFLKSIPPAMNITNPPVSLDVIALYCQGEYTKLAIQAFTYTSQRVGKSKMMHFAETLVKAPVSVKKHGIRMIFRISSKDELREFVRKMILNEKHVSIRELLSRTVYERLAKTPNDENWEMVKICIDALTAEDEVPLNVFCEPKTIDNAYTRQYIELIFNKIAAFSDAELPKTAKTKLYCLVLYSISFSMAQRLPEDMILMIFEQFFFDNRESPDLYLAAKVFSRNIFCCSYVSSKFK